MFKRNLISAAFSAIVFTMLCLFPSLVPAQAPGELRQQKDPPPPTGSRSNINNHRTGVGRFDPIMIHLGKASGDKVATREIADADNDGMISDREAAFDFGVLPTGDYELKVSSQESTDDVDANATRGVNVNNPKNKSDVRPLTVTLTGVVGGTLTHELKADLGSELGSAVARAGKPKFKNITFKADGKGAVKGLLRHEAATNGTKNAR